ncbi:ABC transporter substrate-binding protein [Hamadaea tsunoensis]|uniref:ABC transporter substrate-binding protein n=1 Tax=Hamadaea tsunoensis TaxID=53368 RepID=UPI0003FB6F6A|nr:ABC transporter substrate-binding protein [Hamadaea tsunoensis]
MDGFSRRTALGGVLALVTAPVLGGVRADAMDSPVRVGVLTDLTGPLAPYAQRLLAGMRYRADELGGGHGGMPPIELVVQDAAGDPKTAQDATAALLDQGVHALVGASVPWLCAPLVEMGQTACTPVVLPVSGTPPTESFVFQSGPTAQQVVKAALRNVQSAGLTKVAQLALDKAAAPDLLGAAASDLGLQVAGVETFALDATDLSGPAGKIAAAKPEAVLVSALPPQSGPAVQALKDAGFTGPVLVSPEGVLPDLPEGTKAVAPWVINASGTPETVPNVATLRRFAAGYATANGPVTPAAGFGADAITLVHQAFLGTRDRKAARAQLEGLCCLGVCGVFTVTPEQHAGLAPDALAVATMTKGVWTF